MAKKEQGRIVSVDIHATGDELVSAHAAEATTLYLNDVADFDDDGGQVQINGVVYDFLSKDDDLSTLLLRGPGLQASAAEDDQVRVYPLSSEKWATVILEDGEDSVLARIPMFLSQDVEDGVRDEPDQENCVVELQDTEWVVVDIIGYAEEDGPKFEADDFYIVTAEDVAAGEITFQLSHKPVNESVVCWWRTTPQEPTEYSVDYDLDTLFFSPIPSWVEAGDRMWAHYSYLKGYHPINEEEPLAIVRSVGMSVTGGLTNLPAGTVIGDTIIVLTNAQTSSQLVDGAEQFHTTLQVPGASAAAKVYIGKVETLQPISVIVNGDSGAHSRHAFMYTFPAELDLDRMREASVSGAGTTTFDVPAVPGQGSGFICLEHNWGGISGGYGGFNAEDADTLADWTPPTGGIGSGTYECVYASWTPKPRMTAKCRVSARNTGIAHAYVFGISKAKWSR